jgi:Glycosyl hydrolase family 36 C-terminal domain
LARRCKTSEGGIRPRSGRPGDERVRLELGAAARGVLFAFRGSTNETAHRYVLKGLDPERSYRIAFHDRGAAGAAILSGATLMRDGVEVTLATPLSSELVFIDDGRTAR